MKTCYYAHPIALYGTAIETHDINALRALGFKVTNPADLPGLPMDEYVKITRSHDIIVFRAFADGKIGAGVAKEIEGARAAGIPVIELPSQLAERTLTRNETRARMGLPKLRRPETAPFGTMTDDPDLDDFGDQ